MHVTLVDICWTLYSSNTTYDFCLGMGSNEGEVRRPCGAWLRKLNVLAYKLTGIDFYRRHLVSRLRGMTRESIDKRAAEFVGGYLESRRIGVVWSIVPRSNVVLLSSTLDVIARQVAAKFASAEYHATQLDFDENGVCLGTLTSDLQHRKLEVVSYDSFDVFTDNLSDLPLIAKARRATVVVYKNHDKWLQRLEKHGIDKSKITFVYATTERY